MGLENITSLNDLNVALKNTLDQVHAGKGSPIAVGIASRNFTLLLDKDKKTIAQVKMVEILDKFEDLLKKIPITSSPQDKKLIGDICDRIVELDFEGDVELKKKGGLIDLRDFLRLFKTSHLYVIDDIERKYLSNDSVVLQKIKQFSLAMGNADTHKNILIEALNDSQIFAHTINALRALVRTHPNDAKAILKSLKSILDKTDHTVPNPYEEIEAMQEFLDALKIDINSRGLFREDKIEERVKGQKPATKPIQQPQEPNFEKLKSYEDTDHPYEWIPGELAVKFTYYNKGNRSEQKRKMEDEINKASEKSLYQRQPVKLAEIDPANRYSQTQIALKLNTEDVFFLLGKRLSKTQFNAFLCQEIWDDIKKKYAGIESQITAQQLVLLKTMITKMSDEFIEEFFKNNKINLTNERFYFINSEGKTTPSILASFLITHKPELFAKLMSKLKTKDSTKYEILSSTPSLIKGASPFD